MLIPIRRVVTGLNAEGRSIILSDETVTTVGEVQSWPGNGVTAVWTSNISPANNRDEDLPRPITGFPRPGTGGVSLMIMHNIQAPSISVRRPKRHESSSNPRVRRTERPEIRRCAETRASSG
jgi:hypothetical protein